MYELIKMLWCMSPLALIPICIGLSSSNKKMKSFIERLYNDNRISWREKLSMLVEPHRRQQPMQDDHRPQPGMPYLPQDIERYRQQHGMQGVYRPGGLNYPNMTDTSPVFRDETRKGQPIPGSQVYRPPVPPVQAPNAMNYQGTPDQFRGVNIPPAQQTNVMSGEEQERIFGKKPSNTAGEPLKQAEQEQAPHHHHDGVDLVKHDENKEAETKKKQPEVRPQTAQPAAAQTAQPRQGAAPFYGQQVYNGYPAGAQYGNNAVPQWAQQRPPIPPRPVVPPKPKREKKHYSLATVLTGIGITFIVLAGIIFSTAFWVKMSDWTRVGVLAGQAALFFGMFGFAHKKLKLEGTAAAVYILGSVYTTIAYITTGYFGLFGAWFGIEGGGMMLFLALGALLVTFFATSAMKVFGKPVCEYVASISIAISGTLLLAQFANYFEKNYSAFALLITAAGTICTAVYLFLKHKGKEISKPVVLTHNIVRLAYLIIGLPALVYDIARDLDDMGWTVFGWGICVIYMCECLWHAIRLRSNKWLLGHEAFVIIGTLSLYLNLRDYPFFSVIVMLFSMAGGWTYLFLKKKDKLLFNADAVYTLMRILFYVVTGPLLLNHKYDDPLCFVVAGLWIIDHTGLAVYHKRQANLIPQCLVVLNLLIEMFIRLNGSDYPYNTLPDSFQLCALITLLIGMAGTALYRVLDMKGKALVKADGINMFMRIVMGIPAFFAIAGEAIFEGTFSELGWAICLLLLYELTVYALMKRRQNELFFQFIFVMFAVFIAFREDIEFYGAERFDLFAMTLWGICLVGTAVYSVLRHFRKNLFNAGAFIITARILTAVIGLISVSGDIYNCDGRFSWFSWVITGGMAAEMLIYAIIKKDERLLAVHALYLTGIIFEAGFLLDDASFFTVAATAFIAVMTMIYFTLDVKGKLRFNADRVMIGMRIVFAVPVAVQVLGHLTEWQFDTFGVCAIIATETLYYSISKKSESHLAVHILFLTLMIEQVGVYLGKYEYFAMILFGVAAVGTFVYYQLHKAGKLRFDAKRVVIGTRVAYAILFVPMVLLTLLNFDRETMALFGLLCVEALYYGISMKKESLIGVNAFCLTGIIWQVTLYLGNNMYFALMCCGVAAIGTLAYTLLGKAGKRTFDTPFVLAGVRSFYGIMCVIILPAEWQAFTWISVVIWSILAAEAVYYGLMYKNKLLLGANGIVMLTLFTVVSNVIGRRLPGEYTELFIFAMLTAAMLVVYRIIRALYTKVSDLLMLAVLFISGVWLMNAQALPYGIITMLMVAVFIAIDAFDDVHFLRVPSRVILPLPVIITAYMLSVSLRRDYYMFCRSMSMAICAGVLCAAAFILSFGISEDKKFSLMKYSTEIGAVISLLMAYSLRRDLASGVAVMIVSVAVFAVIQSSKYNFHSALPVVSLFMGAVMTARSVWFDPMREGSAVIVFSMFMTAVLAVVSRLMFADGLIKKAEGTKLQFDIPHFGILLCVLSCQSESKLFSPRARLFIALLELAVFSANFIRRNSSDTSKKFLMTLATGFAAAALIVRPFMAFENAMITTKIILLIIVLFGLAVKKIWAENEKVSAEFSQAVFMAAFLLLIVDGLMNQSLVNSLIVLSVSLILLIFSFIRKTRRWFLVSAVSLLGLTLYITGDFLAAIAWWAYLLIAGILLIVVAAATEYFRQRTAKNPQEDRFFVDWKW